MFLLSFLDKKGEKTKEKGTGKLARQDRVNTRHWEFRQDPTLHTSHRAHAAIRHAAQPQGCVIVGGGE